jgi:hypothetical protein
MSEPLESQTTLKQPNQSTLDAIEDEQAETMTLEELKAWLLESES